MHLIDVENPHYLNADDDCCQRITFQTRWWLVLKSISCGSPGLHSGDLLILLGVVMDQPTVGFVAHIIAVQLQITSLHHGDTKTRVTSELMFCK